MVRRCCVGAYEWGCVRPSAGVSALGANQIPADRVPNHAGCATYEPGTRNGVIAWLTLVWTTYRSNDEPGRSQPMADPEAAGRIRQLKRRERATLSASTPGPGVVDVSPVAFATRFADGVPAEKDRLPGWARAAAD